MKDAAVRALPLGLYRIHYTESAGGGYSLGVVGNFYDGAKWMACANWTAKPPRVEGLISNKWENVERVEPIRTLQGDKYIALAHQMTIKQPLDPEIVAVVRDMFLDGHDTDAVAVLGRELGLSQMPATGLLVMRVFNAALRYIRKHEGGLGHARASEEWFDLLKAVRQAQEPDVELLVDVEQQR